MRETRAGRSRQALFLALAAAATLLPPAPAAGHAALTKASPGRRALLARAPARVELWFSERLEGPFSTVSVLDGAGAPVDLKDVRVGPDDPKRLSVGVPDLAPGAYTVKYRVLSVDGHVIEGEYRFTLTPRR